MIKITIGCDPDSKEHGISIYVNGSLRELSCMNLMTLMEKIIELQGNLNSEITMHIENVCGSSAAFTARDSKQDPSAKLKMAQFIGMCKQSQIEVERLCEYLGVPVVKHKISKQWKCAKVGRPAFEKATGWTKQSNKDSRSAAYFGYLGCMYDK